MNPAFFTPVRLEDLRESVEQKHASLANAVRALPLDAMNVYMINDVDDLLFRIECLIPLPENFHLMDEIIREWAHSCLNASTRVYKFLGEHLDCENSAELISIAMDLNELAQRFMDFDAVKLARRNATDPDACEVAENA